MGQPITKVSFSVGSKLLASVLGILISVVFFLNSSAIVLLKQDKVAYTYQMQSVESRMVALEFRNLISKSIETLKVALATIDPQQPVTRAQRDSIATLVRNQEIVTLLTVKILDTTWSRALTLISEINPDIFSRLQLKEEGLTINQGWYEQQLNQILSHGVVFFSANQVGVPLLGLVVADTRLKDRAQGIPIAIGYVSLDQIANRGVSSMVTVADRMGSILYDSDPQRMFGKKDIRSEPLFQLAKNSKSESGAGEIEDPDGREFFGSYVKVDNGVFVLSKTPRLAALRGAYTMTERFVLLGLLAIGAGLMFSILFSKQITGPLARLYQATKEVSAGNFELSLAVTSRDELGALSSSFNVMSEKIRGLIASSVESVKIENELAIASVVQQTLIPPAVYEDEHVVIRSHYQSATTCGGDWWGFTRVGGRMAIMIADATGHGFPSALITAAARSCLSVIERLSDTHPELVSTPAQILSYANRSIYDSAKGQIMMTFFVGIIDFEKQTLHYASAGHNPPWLLRNSGEETFVLDVLMARGQRLGELSEVSDFEEKSISIKKGDILFLYTDGIIEGKNPAGEEFGKKTARKILERTAPSGPESMIRTLVQSFKEHNANKPLDDDFTLAAVQIK